MTSYEGACSPSRLDVQRHRLDEERALYRGMNVDLPIRRELRGQALAARMQRLSQIPRDVVVALRIRSSHGGAIKIVADD